MMTSVESERESNGTMCWCMVSPKLSLVLIRGLSVPVERSRGVYMMRHE